MCINIVFSGIASDSPFVVIDKPSGMPSFPNALSETIKLFPEIARVRGSSRRNQNESGLIHRIDTETRGLLLFALTQDAYDFFIGEQENDFFLKQYTAFCDQLPDICSKLEGFPPSPHLPVIESRFRPWGKGSKEVRPVTSVSGKFAGKKAGTKLYKTEISLEALPSGESITLQHNSQQAYKAVCSLSRGFRHQVRCHLAWTGYPVIGDALYHPEYRTPHPTGFSMRFFASGLHFRHPITGAFLDFSIPIV